MFHVQITQNGPFFVLVVVVVVVDGLSTSQSWKVMSRYTAIMTQALDLFLKDLRKAEERNWHFPLQQMLWFSLAFHFPRCDLSFKQRGKEWKMNHFKQAQELSVCQCKQIPKC